LLILCFVEAIILLFLYIDEILLTNDNIVFLQYFNSISLVLLYPNQLVTPLKPAQFKQLWVLFNILYLHNLTYVFQLIRYVNSSILSLILIGTHLSVSYIIYLVFVFWFTLDLLEWSFLVALMILNRMTMLMTESLLWLCYFARPKL
jgi:hypothetical protein